LRLHSRSPDETRRAAEQLARALGETPVPILLVGPLGAGKTEFAKGLAAGHGIPAERIQSPTFVIAHEVPLPGGRRLVHVDCYRVESELELEGAGLLDWLAPDAVTLVEWGDRFAAAWPVDRLEVRIERLAEREREIRAVAGGPQAAGCLERWRSLCAEAGELASSSA
jgi:tRNA threonylcarbamoyladenosine biosynthesis protein TsaE